MFNNIYVEEKQGRNEHGVQAKRPLLLEENTIAYVQNKYDVYLEESSTSTMVKTGQSIIHVCETKINRTDNRYSAI